MENGAAPAAPSQGGSEGSNPGAEQQGGEGREAREPREPREGEAPPKQEYRKIKVNGIVRTVPIDEVEAAYSKVKAADEMMARATKMEKSAQAFMEALQHDPEAVLSDPRLPIDKQKIAMKWLRAEIEKELKEPTDPKDIKLRDTEAQLAKYRAAEEAKAKQEQNSQYQALVEKRREAIASDLTKALELTPFAKDPAIKGEVLHEMAMYLRICRQRGYEVTPQDIATHIRSTHANRYASLANAHSGEELANLLGESVIKKLRQYDLERIRSSRTSAQAPETADSWQAGRKPNREFVNPDDLKRRK